ncbi:hypothetical protein [Rhizobium sp. B21/90]|nr:hypothetical protein [Rhizobium sp. B21/90]
MSRLQGNNANVNTPIDPANAAAAKIHNAVATFARMSFSFHLEMI